MVIGDPYKFSILVEVIEEWNLDDTFHNGILLFSIDGNFFPKEIVTTTLKREVRFLHEKLMNPAVNEKIFEMQTNRAFSEIYNITFPEDFLADNDYSFDITPESFSDRDCFVFAVSNGRDVRIMAASLDYIVSESRHDLQNAEIIETSLSLEELKEMASKLAL